MALVHFMSYKQGLFVNTKNIVVPFNLHCKLSTQQPKKQLIPNLLEDTKSKTYLSDNLVIGGKHF
jgi:hypothetical protein